jgi:hypothetical protein
VVVAGAALGVALTALAAPTAQAVPVVGTVSVCLTINDKQINADLNGQPLIGASVSQPTTCVVVP